MRTPSPAMSKRIAASFGRTDHAAWVWIYSGGSADHLDHAQSALDYHHMPRADYIEKYASTKWAYENLPAIRKVVSPIWGYPYDN